MLIISTAGHIDHGKSSLITALNGFVGDSTPEEIKRAITIDLSFSNLDDISFIDVPGHENLLKTMIGGIQSEYAMLVVDINEGLKAQTLEHIFILKIIGVKNIILVLNKIDICKNIKESKEKIIKELSFTPSAVFLVSAKNGDGIDELKKYLLALPRPSYEDFALKINIDRVFSVKGVGNVATGLLKSGKLECKNYMNEDGKSIQVKSIEVQHKSVTEAYAPARVAFVYKGELKPSDIVYSKGYLRTTKEVFCTLVGELKHNEEVLFCCANKQISAKYLKYEEFAKFELSKPCAFTFNEPFIVLKNSRALAGGRVLNAICEPLKKNKMISLLRALRDFDYKSAFRILNTNHKTGFGLFCAPQRFNLSTEKALEYAKEVGEIVDLNGACVYAKEALLSTKEKIIELFNKNPYSLQSAKSLEKSLGIDEFLCNLALKDIKDLEVSNGLYHKIGVKLEKILESNEDIIYNKLNSLTPDAPYNIYDELNLDRKSGDDIIKKLCFKNKVIRLAHNYFISKIALDTFIKDILPELKNGVGVQELKQKYDLSRKYAIALLEYLDTQKGIKNIDNKRYLM